MKLIKPSFEIIEPTGYTIDDIYKSIELAGKVSHKSENTITEDSAKKFVDRMIKLGHGATLEFGTVYLAIPCEFNGNQYNESWKESKYNSSPYSRVKREYVESERNYVDFITTNIRVLVENNWLDDLKYICEPTEYHEKRICVKFICDRGILAEFTRHRKFSFMAESTRYCNYSKGKFNNELTFIIPPFADAVEGSYVSGYDVLSDDLKKPYGKGTLGGYFYESLRKAEESYMELVTHQGIDPNIKVRLKPEQARNILPLALKTELYMCGFVEDWEHFFELRDDKQHAHPQAYELAHPLHEEFIKRKYITN